MKWAEDKREFDLEHIPDAPEHETPWVRCITRGHPAGMFPAGYNTAYQIIQVPGYVVFVFEMIHETRIVPIDGRPALGAGIQQWGHRPHPRYPSERVDEGHRAVHAVGRKDIDYRVTIDDPKVYSTVDGGVAAEP